MEINLLQESTVWRKSREKRAIAFVKSIAYIMLTIGFIWIILTIIQGLYLFTAVIFSTFLLAATVLYLLKQQKIAVAKTLIVFTATYYFLFICIFYSGPGFENNGTAHFWFIVLSAVAYYLLYDFQKIIRDTVPLFFLVLFFLFQFGYAPYIPISDIPAEQARQLAAFDFITGLLVFYIITRQFVSEITSAEKALTDSADKMEGLIENILPPQIAERLRREGKTFADEFHDCSVLFADIVGFTHWSEKQSPTNVTDRLNTIFSRFDEVVERMGLTKIKTIGDAYMVAAGIPEYRGDHAIIITQLAVEIHRIAAEFEDLKFRIGINSGSVVAGIIGRKSFIYDLWGDTVNVASRMESYCHIGKTQISENTYELIKDHFDFEDGEYINIKGKGPMKVFFLKEKGKEENKAALIADKREKIFNDLLQSRNLQRK
ncbi:MAG: adenylate/guanylate cyclase domain-containing protein [Bacteroidia bacterium]